jgi:hypothetical protein
MIQEVIERIMSGPLDEAVRVAVGRAATCWNNTPGPLGWHSSFDEQTSEQIIAALLARIGAEVAVESARVRGDEEWRALIPTASPPARTVELGQCPRRLRLEGHTQHSQCLLLEDHDGDVHENGNLRWRHGPAGEIDTWWHHDAYQVIGLGELLRSGVSLTIPHLPAAAAEELARQRDRASDLSPIDVSPEVADLEHRFTTPEITSAPEAPLDDDPR